MCGTHALICLNWRQEQLSSEELARSICTNPARVRKIAAGAEAGRTGETARGMRVATDGKDPAALYIRSGSPGARGGLPTNWRGGGVISLPGGIGHVEVMDGLLEDALGC